MRAEELVNKSACLPAGCNIHAFSRLGTVNNSMLHARSTQAIIYQWSSVHYAYASHGLGLLANIRLATPRTAKAYRKRSQLACHSDLVFCFYVRKVRTASTVTVTIVSAPDQT